MEGRCRQPREVLKRERGVSWRQPVSFARDRDEGVEGKREKGINEKKKNTKKHRSVMRDNGYGTREKARKDTSTE